MLPLPLAFHFHPSIKQPIAMECPLPTSFALSRSSHTVLFKTPTSSSPNLDLFGRRRCCWSRIRNRRLRLPTRIPAVTEAASAAGVPDAEITWQILAGAVGNERSTHPSVSSNLLLLLSATKDGRCCNA
ncbi:hypothetical protein ACLOJK_000727 [Asimina triloba]